MNSEYLNAVSKTIGSSSKRAEITEELMSHLYDKRDYYLELGYDEEEALRRAEEDMGDPDDCAVPLNAVHPKNKISVLTKISIIFEALFLATAIIRPEVFCYGSEYFLGVFHSIGVDLISFGFVAGFAVILTLAGRRKRKGTAASVIVCLSAYFIISLINIKHQSMCGMFQPAVYMLLTLFTKGFNGYIDRIFAYQYTPWDEKSVFIACAVIIFALLLLWAVYIILTIVWQERLYDTRVPRKVLNIINAVVCLALAVSFIPTAVCTAIAATRLPEKQAAAKAERREMIDLVLDGNIDSFRQEIHNGSYKSYYETGSFKFTKASFYNADTLTNNTYQLIMYGLGGTFGYSVTNYGTDLPLLSRDIRLTDEEYRQYKSAGGLTVESLRQFDWYDKAVTVTNLDGSVQMVYLVPDGTITIMNDPYEEYTDGEVITY